MPWAAAHVEVLVARVFLAGASGVIGRSLVGLLHGSGHEVIGMTRSAEHAEAIKEQGAEAVVCDAFDSEAVRSAAVAARPDALIHEGAQTVTIRG